MKRPRFTDAHRGRYRTAEESKTPGYLAKRFAAFRRLQRMQARSNVAQLPKRKVSHG